MNTRTTVTLLTIALAIGIYFIFFETDLFDRKTVSDRDRDQDRSQTEQIGQPLFKADALPVDDVKTIRLERGEEPPAVIKRDPDKPSDWVQTEPVRFAMQTWQVRDIVTDASELHYTSKVNPSKESIALSSLGLDPPRMTLTLSGYTEEYKYDGKTYDSRQTLQAMLDPLNAKDEAERSAGEKKQIENLTAALASPKRTDFSHVIKIGNTTAAGRAYLQLGEQRDVYVVEDKLHKALMDKKIREMRSTSLTSIAAGQARRVRLTHEGATIELLKRDDRWALVEPVAGRADRQAVESLIGAIGSAFVDKFVQDNPSTLAPFGLDSPQTALEVEVVNAVNGAADDEAAPTEQTTTHKLAIGGPEGLEGEKFFAMYNEVPVVFTLRKADVEKLQKSVDDLRDSRLTPVARADVKEVTIERAERKLHFLQESGVWVFGDPKPGFDLDVEQMTALLDAIFDARASAYVPLAGDPPGEKLADITLGVLAADNETLSVHAHETSDKLLIVRGGEKTGYIVDRESVELALADPLAFRDRNVLDISEASIARIDINRSGQYPAQYTIQRKPPQQAGPPLPGEQDADDQTKPGDWDLSGLDAATARAVIAAFAPLRADEWLAERPITTPEGVAVTLTLADGAKHHIMVHSSSRTTTVQGVPAAFKVSQATVDALEAELADRVVLRIDVDEIKSVERGATTVHRDDEGRYQRTGEGVLDESKAATLFDTLAGLSVDHYVDALWASGEPTVTLKITLSDDKVHELKVWTPKDRPAVGQLGEQTFTLDAETAKNLTTNPVD